MIPGTHKTRPTITGRSGKTASLATRRHGFTLIEIMITLAIAAILAAIAYPSYVDQVRKSRRGQLKADLVELAQFLERRFTNTNSYDQGPAGVDVADIPVAFTTSPRSSAGTAVNYAITVTAIAASSFALSAARANAQANDPCGTFTLNQAGVKTAAMANCW